MQASAFPDPVASFLVLAALGLVPFMAMVVTSFTKVSVVLLLTRNALGVKEAPPAMVINGFAVILSCYIMAPVGHQALSTLNGGDLRGKPLTTDTLLRIAESAKPPLIAFLKKHTNQREKKFFMKSAQDLWPKELAASLTDEDLLVLVPSFTITELTAAFQIGFLIYLAFMVVDFVVASILLALNMSMISPTVISVPLKILLFVALDGWTVLIHNLVLTYR